MLPAPHHHSQIQNNYRIRDSDGIRRRLGLDSEVCSLTIEEEETSSRGKSYPGLPAICVFEFSYIHLSFEVARFIASRHPTGSCTNGVTGRNTQEKRGDALAASHYFWLPQNRVTAVEKESGGEMKM